MIITQEIADKMTEARRLLYTGDADAVRLFEEIVQYISTPESAEQLKTQQAAKQGLAEANFLRGAYTLQNWHRYDGRLCGMSVCRPWQKGDKPKPGSYILVRADQGRGDTLQFARYLPLLLDAGYRVILECLCSMIPLFRTCFEGYVQRGLLSFLELNPKEAPDTGDVGVFLCSLPSRLAGIGHDRLTPESLPEPYLVIPRNNPLLASWKERVLQDSDGRTTVGIAWRGSDCKYRPCKVRDFEPLLQIPDTKFFSVTNEPANFAHPSFVDHSSSLTDFEQTAALINAMDIVISVDTSIAHLAGAMGKTTITLVHSFHDWRWGLEGSESKWYPGRMTLVREGIGEPHSSSIDRLREELVASIEKLGQAS